MFHEEHYHFWATLLKIYARQKRNDDNIVTWIRMMWFISYKATPFWSLEAFKSCWRSASIIQCKQFISLEQT